MKTGTFFLLVCGIIFSFLNSDAQGHREGFEHLFTPPEHYVAGKTSSEIKIDGRADETSWQQAVWTAFFRDIEGDSRPAPLFRTRAKMLWDKNNLYIFAEMEEPHVWAYYDKNDMIVYHENDFEVFIDPDGDTHNYYEFELNAQNILLDLFMDRPYRSGGTYDIQWNASGFKSAVYVDGTLNDPKDRDRKWTVEMAIPFSSLTTDGRYLTPSDGDTWKINFSRVQWQTEVVNGKYQKKKDRATGKNLHEYNWVWSPQGVINMHYPERWGMVQFSEKNVRDNLPEFVLPMKEKLAPYLWLIHYKQKAFKRKNGSYADSVSALGIPEKGEADGISFKLELNTDAEKFVAFLVTENGQKLSINQSGLFQVRDK